MTTKVGIAALVALGIVLAASRGADLLRPASAAPLQEGWPVPVSDARAQYALTLETSDPVHIGKTTLHRARCVSWVTLRAADGADGLELLRTQGRVGGSIEIEEEGERRATKPFVSALDLHAVLLGEGAAPGRTVTRAVEGASSRRSEASAAWTLLGIVPPPPAESEIAAGLAWTADAAWPLFPARVVQAHFELEAVEAETLRVRATWPETDLLHGWTAPEAEIAVDISRRDGLAFGVAFAVTFTSTESAQEVGGDVSVAVTGTLARLEWTDPPAPGPDVEDLARGLADPDPVTRAKAAKRLGAAWPDAGRVATALVAAREDEDPRVRRVASDALRHLAGRGVSSILAFLDEPLDADREGYEGALTVILRLGAKITLADLAAAGTVSPPSGAMGLLTLHPFGADVERIQDAVWMLEGMASMPAVLGSSGYEDRNRELAATTAAFLGLAGSSQDAGRAPPSGVLERLGAPRLGTQVAALAMLTRWGGATPEVLEALRQRLVDEDDPVARGARFALGSLGHPVVAETGPSVEDLIESLDRFDDDGVLSDPSHVAIHLIEDLVARGEDALPAVEALEGLAKRTRARPDLVHARAVAALVQLAGPTRARRAVLIQALETHLAGPDPEPWTLRPLLAALAVDANRMEEDEARRVVRLIEGYGDGKEFLHVPWLRRLLLAIDLRHQGSLEAVWIEQLARIPPHTADLLPSVPETRQWRVIPGTERFHAAVELGAKLHGALGMRRDLLDAAGRYRGDDERVRAALERLVAQGDAWTRTVAARAIRRLEAR